MNNSNWRGFFANGYLMVTSVIQATTFAALILVADKLSESELWRLSPYLLCSFLMLVNLLYGYLDGSRDLKWPLDGFDVLLPVLLGVFQCAAMLSLATKQTDPEVLWFRWTLLVTITIMAVVVNAWIKTFIFDKKNYPVRKVEYQIAMVFLIVGLIITVAPVATHYFGWWKHWFVCLFIWLLVVMRVVMFFIFCLRDWKNHRKLVTDARE
jgi:hypothetical protein